MDNKNTQNHVTETAPARIVERYASLRKRAQTEDFNGLDSDVVVIDTETTGISYNHDELTQIAAARMEQGAITEWFVTFVNPGKPIPEDVSHLTDIHDSDVADAPSADEALTSLVEFVGESKLVAHNADFDKHFCTKSPAGWTLRENTWIDSLDLARIALPRLKSHRLIDLVKTFDAPVSTHRADADVEALCAVYRVLLAAVCSMPPDLVAHIAQMDDGSHWPTVEVFKKLARDDAPPFDLKASRSALVAAVQAPAKTDAEAIAADPLRTLTFADDQTIADAFSTDGLLGKIYPKFEAREEQVEMALAVNRAFSTSTNLAVEAGTGVGKSMAYLVPARCTAQANNITVGVATKTNALLDQLMNKELPALAAASEDGLTYACLKGFSRYPCLRNVQHLLDQGPKTREVNGTEVFQAAALAGLLSFIEQSDYDDIDGLKIDYRALPRYLITTTSAECLRRRCPFFGTSCFVHGARARAEQADILVTNHALLFCDLALDGGLLPPVRYWVVDEAHGAEDEARRAFSYTLDVDEIGRLRSRIAADDASRNVFLRAERRLAGRAQATDDQVAAALGEAGLKRAQETGTSQGDTLLFALSSKARAAGKVFDAAAGAFCDHIDDLLYFDDSRGSRGYDRVELWLNDDIRASSTFKQLAEYGRALYDAAEKEITACQELVGFMENIEGAGSVQRDIAAVALQLRELLPAMDIILFEGSPAYAFSAHLSRKRKEGRKLEALMLDVGDRMRESLYERTHSVVFTSATMTIADSFDSFTGPLGLVGEGSAACRTCSLPSSYDFDTHMRVFVTEDMPEPTESGYLDALNQLLIEVHRAQEGSVLTLFTNRREMEKSYAVVQAALRSDDLRVVCQKWGVSTKGLRDDFLADEHLSLFALKSFWEGFDAPGATLKTVVIPKLPFGKPTDPLSCERRQSDPQSWSHFVLPAAVLEIKQAAGRLIRSSEDTGNLILADKRLATKGYGKVFLRSLPSTNITLTTSEQVIRALEAGIPV